MGRQIITLGSDDSTYSCKMCKTFFFKYIDISKYNIETAKGPAYEISSCENIVLSQSKVPFHLNETGNTTLFDDTPVHFLVNIKHESFYIHCILCNLLLGWKYKQRYIIKNNALSYNSSLVGSELRNLNP